VLHGQRDGLGGCWQLLGATATYSSAAPLGPTLGQRTCLPYGLHGWAGKRAVLTQRRPGVGLPHAWDWGTSTKTTRESLAQGPEKRHNYAGNAYYTPNSPVRKETTHPRGYIAKVAIRFQDFSLLHQYIADSYVSDNASENYACKTLAFKMLRFLCVPQVFAVDDA
jgi:hypothetical protein